MSLPITILIVTTLSLFTTAVGLLLVAYRRKQQAEPALQPIRIRKNQ